MAARNFSWLLCAALCVAAGTASFFDDADPIIGTGGQMWGRGSQSPAAQVPFGAFRLGPDTSIGDIHIGWLHCSGYDHMDTHVRCFSHTRLVGAGVPDFGHFGFMPAFATPATQPELVRDFNYKSRFSHATEVARPGYYAVTLDDLHVRAEMAAAGTHAGLHRYTFPDGTDARVLLVDVCHNVMGNAAACTAGSVEWQAAAARAGEAAAVEMWGTSSIAGYLSGHKPGGVPGYFHARITFSGPAAGSATGGVWAGSSVTPSGRTGTASNGVLGAYVEGPGCSAGAACSVTVEIGISFIDVAHARNNLAVQAAQRSFDEVVRSTEATWRRVLDGFSATFPADADAGVERHKLASSVYRTFMSPTTYTEPSVAQAGSVEYRGMDDGVHTWPFMARNGSAIASGFYSDLSLWDTHRSQMPWLTLVQPQVALDTANSLLAMSDEGGALPRWPLANVYTGCMEGDHGIVVLADTVEKDLGLSADRAFAAAKRQATEAVPHTGRPALQHYLQFGYIPYETQQRGASYTLDYAYDDWAVGQLAKATRQQADKQVFYQRGQNYRAVWSHEHRLACPRYASTADAPGAVACPILPSVPHPLQAYYVEGSGHQWRWYVPHDPAGLVALFGGAEAFVAELESYFRNSKYLWEGGFWPFGNVLPHPLYWAGNEPDLLVPWQFVFAGRPDRTQYWTRWMLRHRYSQHPDGVPGNDDYGTMSAWHNFGSLGLYPLSGSKVYLLGSPVVASAEVPVPEVAGSTRGAGRFRLRVVAHDNSARNVYVQRVALNGQPLETPYVTHQQLLGCRAEGCKESVLEFWMGPAPSTWGRGGNLTALLYN